LILKLFLRAKDIGGAMASFIDKAFSDGHLRIDQSGRVEKIVYVAANRRERWSDPEEKIRAEFYAELIYRYGYSPDRIGIEITVPDRSPNDFADIVVFRDNEKKRPFAVVECKKESISDAEFNQAVEQAWGNGNAAKFRAAFVGVVAGATRRFFDCDDKKFGALGSVLDSPTGRSQLNVLKGRSAQPHVNADEVRSLLVPCPSDEVQLRLLTALNAARATRRDSLSQAEALLSGLDGFVLDALGLTLPSSSGHMAYSVKLRDARQRLDPYYNSPRCRALRDKIEHGEFPSQTVGSLFHRIITGFAAGGGAQTKDLSEGVPHIRPLNITNTAELTFEGTKMVPRSAVGPSDFVKKGEILFNNTNSTAWVGKTVVFDADCDCACSNHITRLALIERDYNPYYFAAVLNALRSVGFFGLLATNFNNQAGINVDTLKCVRLPVPDPKFQGKISAEVLRRRDEARRLREEARTIWDDAKRRFEEELLRPESEEEPKTGRAKAGRSQ
jgi:restriction endonuclease S subunit